MGALALGMTGRAPGGARVGIIAEAKEVMRSEPVTAWPAE